MGPQREPLIIIDLVRNDSICRRRLRTNSVICRHEGSPARFYRRSGIDSSGRLLKLAARSRLTWAHTDLIAKSSCPTSTVGAFPRVWECVAYAAEALAHHSAYREQRPGGIDLLPVTIRNRCSPFSRTGTQHMPACLCEQRRSIDVTQY